MNARDPRQEPVVGDQVAVIEGNGRLNPRTVVTVGDGSVRYQTRHGGEKACTLEGWRAWASRGVPDKPQAAATQ